MSGDQPIRPGPACGARCPDVGEHRHYAAAIAAVFGMIHGRPDGGGSLLSGCEVGNSVAGSTVAASGVAPRQHGDRAARHIVAALRGVRTVPGAAGQ